MDRVLSAWVRPLFCFFFSSRRRHTRYWRDWSSDVCSSDLTTTAGSCGPPASAHGHDVDVGGTDAGGPHEPAVVVELLGDGGHRDRKSVVEGKRVDFGGRRIIKKKKTDKTRARGSADKYMAA